MTPRAARSLVALVAAALAPAAGYASASAAGTTEPPSDTAPGCAEITAALDAVNSFTAGVFGGEPEAVEPLLATIPELGAAAAEAAPPEIADAVSAWVAPFPDIAAALEAIDLSDLDAMISALSGLDTSASDAALAEVSTWASERCGWVSAEIGLGEVPEPPDCESLDPAVAASAAGIDVDVADSDGSADVNLPGFWTKSCSYGNGALSLSTLSFTSIADAQAFYADNLDISMGVVLDVDLGSLPESSVAIQIGVTAAADSSVPTSESSAAEPTPSVQVAVFEAPIPFSVTVTGADVDPAAVVAAAEALLATMDAGGTGTGAPVTTAAGVPTTA